MAATLLAYEELTRRGVLDGLDIDTTIVAGHSVGEIAAYAIAGIISADEAVSSGSHARQGNGQGLRAGAHRMSALLGGDEAEVLARLEALDLVPANRNAAGQIVAAGAVSALEKLAEDPPARARVRPLATAGAFHTRYMAPALDEYAVVADRVNPAEPSVTLLSNADGHRCPRRRMRWPNSSLR